MWLLSLVIVVFIAIGLCIHLDALRDKKDVERLLGSERKQIENIQDK